MIAICLAGAPPANAGPFGGKIAETLGAIIARHFERFLPDPVATTPVDPRGGKFCDVMEGLRSPPKLLLSDKLNPGLARWLDGVLTHGVEYCGWSP